MEFSRILKPFQLLENKSYFLFGPRSVGKSYWIKATAPKETLVINLLNSDTYLRLSAQPSLLREMVGKHRLVVIDEVQKIPLLLDEIHQLIEEKEIRFLLTGSSARKLKRQNVNLLGGRAGQLRMFPLTFAEIPEFDLERYLLFGGLPRVALSSNPHEELDAYLSVYLEQEIRAEALVRNLLAFSRFLKTAALQNAELLNFSNIASDSGVPASTVKEYYSVLEDTLIGLVLEPFTESKKRKAIQTAKFYFFDPGVCHFILGVETLNRASSLWGKAFEQFIGMELRSYLSYSRKRQKLCFWRSENKQEVDFVVGRDLAIEVKSTQRVSRRHLAGLRALREEGLLKHFYVVSEDPMERETEGITLLHWKTFLTRLWGGEII